jgi:hypothetical protein
MNGGGSRDWDCVQQGRVLETVVGDVVEEFGVRCEILNKHGERK